VLSVLFGRDFNRDEAGPFMMRRCLAAPLHGARSTLHCIEWPAIVIIDLVRRRDAGSRAASAGISRQIFSASDALKVVSTTARFWRTQAGGDWWRAERTSPLPRIGVG